MFEVIPDGSVIVPTTPTAFWMYLYTLGIETDTTAAGVECHVDAGGFLGVDIEDIDLCPVILVVINPPSPTVIAVDAVVICCIKC